MLRSLKTCRKAIVVCDCSYDCGKNHCDCPRSLSVVGSRRSQVVVASRLTGALGTPTYTARAHTGPVQLPTCILRGKIVRSPCLKDVHAQLSDTGCLRVYGFKKNRKTPCGGPYGMPYDHPQVTGILALTVPVNYPGAPCDLGIRQSGSSPYSGIIRTVREKPGVIQQPNSPGEARLWVVAERSERGPGSDSRRIIREQPGFGDHSDSLGVARLQIVAGYSPGFKEYVRELVIHNGKLSMFVTQQFMM